MACILYIALFTTRGLHIGEKRDEEEEQDERESPSCFSTGPTTPIFFHSTFFSSFLLGPCNVGIIANCVEENRADAELKCNKKKEKVKKRISNENTK
jgi:hypothetical protein